MSKQTKEKMFDYLFMAWIGKLGNTTLERETHEAIRRLIQKVFEWQEKAEAALISGSFVYDLLQEICEFGKETKSE